MIVIDGGMLEGGGQIVRSAVALASVTTTPLKIVNIRANRKTPGLAAQHLAAIRAAAAISSADVHGGYVGSSEIVFLPNKPAWTMEQIDIGTAGSIPLVLSAWLPGALACGGEITVCGGTEVPNAPTIDYFEEVFLEYLRRHGAKVSLSIESRGYYPTGGGIVHLAVQPSEIAPLGRGAGKTNGIVSATSGLPDHVATRQADAAAAIAGDLPIRIVRQEQPGVGSSCTVFSDGHGGSALGRRGLAAEEVGRQAGRTWRAGGSCGIDCHLADQLLLYLAIYGGSIWTGQLTPHAETMIRLLARFGYTLLSSHEGDCVEVSL
ncbi:MAG: RNA 3'-phosphate cyclase [Methanocalculus sp. MSAO_Arc1]|uniref:RNA 3'-terminal phosphate cyclase n=1 Tax=Methanocalculus TaxID=71151 RepID=UPI000FF265C2|nr:MULTISPECIES: RNA 3'-terminal phosphate cyclase [unclassified Methanocalculus]MCP1661393.1 RNA 3'-terminal phosphate cyclase (ATP) [Methanocalculus sp. AMF5]RQD79700.1 MAG: RNA 3'-phosphate cyclase [Methanocalculus sp. MSAO_Arc1]